MSKIELKENLKKYSNLDECPIRNIISRFSGKWPVIILCILSENECTRFNQIQKAIPDISPKVLSDTLKNLETDGIIKRIVYGEVPPRVEYSLTKLGLSLMPYINNCKKLLMTKKKLPVRFTGRRCVKMRTFFFYAQSPDFHKQGLCYYLKILYL